MMWALWKIRNNMVFENNLVKEPREVIFGAKVVIKQWNVVMKGKEAERMDDILILVHEDLKKT